jgi:hypothetical protein
MGNLSDRQRVVADKATTDGILKNKEKLLASHWRKAMDRDVKLFGDQAFEVGWSARKDRSD